MSFFTDDFGNLNDESEYVPGYNLARQSLKENLLITNQVESVEAIEEPEEEEKKPRVT